jgi:23S rRNA maturation mini-RNase III
MKTDLAATAFEAVGWIDLAQDKEKSEVVINKVLTFELY